jgi:hypothetical protein
VIVISKVRRNGTVDLLIVLDEQSIERIRAYDQAEVLWGQLPHEYSARRPNCIGIGFATTEELNEIERLSATDENWKEKAYALVTRGFKFQPDKGDHDFGPITLGKPTPGVKQ